MKEYRALTGLQGSGILKGSRIFNTTYNCDFRSINQVQLPYSEFGKQPRNYTLTEICRLRNAYFTDYTCAGLCGCRISGF
jgi:hypothetical protein